MAARFGIAKANNVGMVANTAKTILSLGTAPNHAIRITELGIACDGIVNTDKPGLICLVTLSADGTKTALSTAAQADPTAVTGTIHKLDEAVADTLDTTGSYAYTVEPTISKILGTWFVHPQTGLVLPANDLGIPIIAASALVAIWGKFVAAVNVSAYLKFEE